MSTFNLEIVTPERSFFEAEVESLIIRTTEGDIAILPDHESLVAPIAVGRMRIRQDGKWVDAFCAGGFMTVSETNYTAVVTDAAEWASEIDVERAERAKQRAEARLSGSSSAEKDIDLLRARSALTRAAARLYVSGSRD